MSSLRVLKTFLAVAAEGSFAAAANRVALTQAAVGQQMRALESELRRPLFERQGKSLVLSPAAREVLPVVRKLVALYEQMLAASPASGAMAGTVHLGAVVSALRPLVQATLALKARHPGLELHVSAAKSGELLARVEAGELDAAIAVREPGSGSALLSWTPLYAEPMVLLAPRHLGDTAPKALLETQPFIRFDRDEHTGRLVERTLRRLRARPREFLELNAIEGIVDLVRSGLGVSVLPLLKQARWARDNKLRVLELPNAEERRVGLAHRRDSAQAAVTAALVREMQAWAPA